MKQAKAKPKVRKAIIDDFDKVYPLLLQMNYTRLTKENWFRLFQDHWSIEEFSPGMVLQLDDQIVGYIGTIYSKQTINGNSHLCCNLTTWIVLDEYRSHSIRMLLPLLRNKNLLLTSFSSNDVTYAVYNKLGFKDANVQKRIVYPFPFFQSDKYELLTDSEQISDAISDQYKAVFNDHKKFSNSTVLIKYRDEQCLLMGVNREQLFRLFYVSDKAFLQKHLKFFRHQLMVQLQVTQIHIDEDLLDGSFLFLSRKVTWGKPYQFKSNLDGLSPSPEYSEIFLLNM